MSRRFTAYRRCVGRTGPVEIVTSSRARPKSVRRSRRRFGISASFDVSRRRLQTLGPFAAPKVVALGALEFLDDLAAFSEEAPRFLSAREEERAEPELVAQSPRTDQIPIGDQPPSGSERKKASAYRRVPALLGALEPASGTSNSMTSSLKMRATARLPSPRSLA